MQSYEVNNVHQRIIVQVNRCGGSHRPRPTLVLAKDMGHFRNPAISSVMGTLLHSLPFSATRQFTKVSSEGNDGIQQASQPMNIIFYQGKINEFRVL